jgi:dCMP deaminase
MKIADIAKRRSNCMKSSVGCVIVNDNNRVVSTGYNGTPRGLVSCYKNGCNRCNENVEGGLDECLCLHGEESAILEVGIFKTNGCKLYTTLYPCFSCAKIIKQAGIKRIYYMTEYKKPDNGEEFLKENYRKEDVVKIEINNIYY